MPDEETKKILLRCSQNLWKRMKIHGIKQGVSIARLTDLAFEEFLNTHEEKSGEEKKVKND